MQDHPVVKKKILFIGSSWHYTRTKSAAFLIDYLKEFFMVDILLDKGWMGCSDQEIGPISSDYTAILFFQVFPNRKNYNEIKNRNVVFIPMYDDCTEDYLWWLPYKDVKILNFCKKLHDLFSSWGFQSLYVQHFPEPQDFAPGNPDEVFFWQRKENVNCQKVLKLFARDIKKIHIHKVMDGKAIFLPPTQAEEQLHSITYSEWFEHKEQMIELIRSKGLFVSPRAQEGIGFSFLEAMAMGKAVIAVNDATMNEYITDQETGYLFDLNNPSAIDLSCVATVQKNTYAYMQAGYTRWMQDRYKIITFIGQEIVLPSMNYFLIIKALFLKVYRKLLA